jgi:hypothetical protein
MELPRTERRDGPELPAITVSSVTAGSLPPIPSSHHTSPELISPTNKEIYTQLLHTIKSQHTAPPNRVNLVNLQTGQHTKKLNPKAPARKRENFKSENPNPGPEKPSAFRLGSLCMYGGVNTQPLLPFP